MALRWGGTHGAFGFVSALLAAKLVLKKGLVGVDVFITHQYLHLPIDLLLLQLPMSVFGGVGRIVVALTGTAIPPQAIGLVLVYPLFVVLVGVWDGVTRSHLVVYYCSATVVTTLAVAASLGMAPDPGGTGSMIVYHLQNHTLAVAVQNTIVTVGDAVSTVTVPVLGTEIGETGGLVIVGTVAAMVYGIGHHAVAGH